MRASVVSAAVAMVITSTPPPPQADLVLRHARIVDGAATPWFRGDVAISGDTIVAAGPGLPPGHREIDVGDRVVAPGFIDIHTHAIRGILATPGADNYVRQGVTTIFEGQDGSSPLPVAAFLARAGALHARRELRHLRRPRDHPPGGPRPGQPAAVGGRTGAHAGTGATGHARRRVRVEHRASSTSLGSFTPTDEVVALARVVGELGGIHVSHMRDEAAGVVDSVRETIEIGEKGHLPTQITHHKIVGSANWRRSRETLRLVEDARRSGRGRHDRSVPVHRVEHDALDGPAPGVGSRGHATQAVRARAGGSGRARPDAGVGG